MNITKELKLVMQVMSFMGMVAAAHLIQMGLHTTFAYLGFGSNLYCLVYWVVIKETNENNKDS